MNRKEFLQTSGLLIANAVAGKAFAQGSVQVITVPETSGEDRFPLMDLHVHRSENLTITDIVEKAEKLRMQIGVMHNIAPWGITNDAELKAYIDEVSPYPVFIGLQPMSPGWSKNLSPELVAKADYIIMDPQIVKNGNGYGETLMIWEYATYVDDPEMFMRQNTAHYLDILTNDEPLDVFACPLLLPYCIERDYYKLWTSQRLRQIIDAAKAKGVAIEINDVMRVPHEEFITMAKKAGLKFTFGSDSRNQSVGRLDYCKSVARKCGLTEKDFFIPERRR